MFFQKLKLAVILEHRSVYVRKTYCQAQYQLASQATVPLELRLALLSLWVLPTRPPTHPAGQVYLSIVEQGRKLVFGRKALG